ncbi:MAG: metallophosphoesterase [Pirellulales bacterium]
MFRILHLSDLHIRVDSTWSTIPILQDAKRIICEQANQENIDAVAFTGDIAFGGKLEEYHIASAWLEDLCLKPTGLNLDAKGVMFVPGNHDVDRSQIPAPARAIENDLFKASEQAQVAAYYLDPDSAKLLRRRHAAYYDFCKSFTGLDDLLLPAWTRVFEHSGKRIRFDGFNSSWLCRGDDDHRRLLIGQPQLSEVMKVRSEADVAIALAHHPLGDLMEFDEKNTIAHLRQNHNLFLRGHLHDADVIELKGGTGGYIEVSAGALHERHESQNRFCIIDVEEGLEAIQVRTFVWLGGRWILDRNLPNADDGVRRIEISRKGPPTRKLETSESVTNSRASIETDAIASFETNLEDVGDSHDEAVEVLSGFPRWQLEATNQQLAIRQASLSEAMLSIGSHRKILIRKDAGSKYDGFVSCIVAAYLRLHANTPVLVASCAGVNCGRDLQDLLATNAQSSVTNFAAALRSIGPAMLILDDLDDHNETEGVSIPETIDALLDFCESLIVVRISGLPVIGDSVIRVGALDPPDTREYLENATNSVTFPSTVDFARVHRVTGGLPIHLDAVLDALTVTNLEGALAQIDSETEIQADTLPATVIHEVNALKLATENEFVRIRRLLWTLSILERGESLSAIKRLDSRNPIWPKHASYLQAKGCLDIVDAAPAHYGATPSMHPGSGDKILRVPRLVRDFVISIMDPNERVELTKAAAALYFGSDWRIGTVRIRRRIAFANEISTHQSGNEITLLRALASGAERYFEGISSPFRLGLSYISQLKSIGFYGEAYEAAREFLGIASSDAQSVSAEELQDLQRFAGNSARMIGEHESCVEFLTSALPGLRSAGEKSVLSDALIDLGLALKALGKANEATGIANEILAITNKESSDYFQAKAVLAEIDPDNSSRLRKLKLLCKRARNLRHFTVADNIALTISSETDNTEEKLKFLSEVKSRGEREYNYVRATIRRVETLLDANRQSEITKLDEEDLWRSYSLAYSQRLSGIFNWCHRVCWRYLEVTNQQERQASLFMVSSFVWRLNGNKEMERMYLELLKSRTSEGSTMVSGLVKLLNYCRSRLIALAKR